MARQDTLFRSAEMSLVQLYVATEIGRETVSALGEVGLMQFRDLNSETSAFQRTFTKEIRRLDNVERQLRFFGAQMEKNNVLVRPVPSDADLANAPGAAEIDYLAERSEHLEQRITQLNTSHEELQKRWVELIEHRHVLREAGSFFDRAYSQADDIRGSTDEPEARLLDDVEDSHQADGDAPNFQTMNIGFVAGVIARDRVSAFERILWRTLRGNLYMNQSEIDEEIVDPASNESVDKNVFVIFAHGKEILAKIRRISESLGADLYSVDEDNDLRRDQLHNVNTRINDLQSVLSNTQNTLQAELRMIAQSLASWMVVIKKEKATYQTLNLFSYDPARKCLIAEGWLPSNALPQIQYTLRDVTDRAGLQVPSILNELKTTKTPPTYNKTNKFTLGFQTIIDAYGVAKYREVNPGLATIVTFPFLFAVMFGDMGHGIIMFCAALAMIYFEKVLGSMKLNEIVGMAFFGRYIMLLMGGFSIYTGFIYNDMFSKPLTLFNSNWHYPMDNYKEGQNIEAVRVAGVYPIGLDWAWHGAENALLFTNSYKMKLSIVMGWAHMTYSLCLSQFNHRFFKSKIDTWGNFIPGMLFLQSIFGYLVLCILYKWSVDWPAIGKPAPSLLNMLINMFLSPGTIEDQLYRGQAFVQIVLLLIALVCIPWMLLLKPLYLRQEHNKHRAHGYEGLGEVSRVSALDDDDDASQPRQSTDTDPGHVMLAEDIAEEEPFEFSEEMIHQVIHTIEFCLNCVSHTASYLRLWALSLAHAQLSIVLWDMTLANVFGLTGVLGVVAAVLIFGFWFCCSVVILVIMEGTSAMLHSLRLHWVEAMSKFFIGDGVAFVPFSFQRLLEEEAEA